VFRLAGVAATYSATEALHAVREYAFGTATIDPDPRFPNAFAPHPVPRYAYRTYDCIPASDGPQFSDLDLLVTAGLNARIDMATFVRLRSFADRAAGHLDAAHQLQPDFLQLHREEVGDEPAEGSAGWYLFEAWRQGMATPGLRVARVHKMLHHKRPWLVPLLDNKTVKPIRAVAKAKACGSWQLIHDEIHAHADHFQAFADEFDKLVNGINDVPLSWLRLYDILVWMKVARPKR
jgi:Family of unknown function (DUF6308)